MSRKHARGCYAHISHRLRHLAVLGDAISSNFRSRRFPLPQRLHELRHLRELDDVVVNAARNRRMEAVEQQLNLLHLDQRAPQVRRHRRHNLALYVERREDFRRRRDQSADFVSDPQVRVVQEADAVTDELHEARLLQQSQLGQRGRRANRFGDDKLFRVAEALLEQRNQDRRAVPAEERGDADDAIEEGSAKVFVFLVVEKCDDVRQDDVVGCARKKS